MLDVGFQTFIFQLLANMRIIVIRSQSKMKSGFLSEEEVDGAFQWGLCSRTVTQQLIPSYLATSPLPDVPDIEAEIQKMKLSLKDETSNENKMLSPIIESTKSIHIVSEKDKVLITSSSLSSKQKDCDIVPSDSVVSKKTTTQISETHKSHQKILKVTEESVVSEDIANSVNTDSSDEYKTKRRRRKRAPTKKRSKNKDMSVTKNNGLNHATDVVTKDSEIDKPEEIFQMDDDYVEGDDEGFGSAGGLSRSVSLPVQSKIEDLFDHEWTRRKMSTTFTGEFHPFSDGDVTPQSSPIGSRPPSPKSDTEYENQKIETGSPDLNAPSWSWGQLPNVPRNLSDPHLQGQDQSSHLNEENKDDDASTDAEKRSMLGGVLNFMRSTKKMRHMPEREGIYLSELNSDELDPEVAALYFPKFKNPDHPSQVKDEDTESGKGPSLPHSPHTVEGYGSHLSQDSDSDGGIPLERFSKEDCEKHSYPYSDIAMSLCGGLQDPEVDLPAERFLHSIITFDEFSENPAAVLNDPNLVIRIDGKSDVLGHILPMVGHSWAQLGVANLFTKIYNNGYKFLYLSARAIGQARITRDYLRKVRQGEICLPDGPLLLSPTSLISALHREVIERKPEEFKISCLKDIQTLFPPYMGNPFYAGFGNKINDQWAYRAVGIPLTRSFTINHRGELKLELIQTFQSSYTRLCDDVDHVFPPLKPRLKTNGHPTPIFSSPEEFSYFTYWREPVPPINEDDLSV
ncbi:Phosphatidate phosphatase LPIN3 like protein [Argiope bruennichi]|uniref:Phosphatidate phosphatase LPIN3 like protein n=1 Tax=Argiope bruennichi TaxID=94029 RepID=A0A8T0E062_ARGBR|nr:Phosphatidate phosphatase LPIN3 like protein [Argiope bruennichi]